MSTSVFDGNYSIESYFSNENNDLLYNRLKELHYRQYLFFAVFSALFGLPSNILLLVILMRIGLFSRRQSGLHYLASKPTGSFERFLFEVVFIDTLLIIYHFVDNFLSYIHDDRSTGQHYLIHVSDFCCKFFTYIAKISVLLTTWLLLFLVINRLILTMDYNHNNRSFWNRGLYYVNAKYSTVFLIFIFSVFNIYPIEVLKYQKKDEVLDYSKEGVPGVCYTVFEGKSRGLLNASNYGYNLVGVAIPCVLILIISIVIVFRTCQNHKYTNKDSHSFHYIAAIVGIVHALFNLPARFSDILIMFLSPYDTFFSDLINFNHQVQSFMSLSYGYKFFVCILISRRFRLHAKSVVCFLIENQYEDRHITDIASASNERDFSMKSKKKHSRHHHHHYHQNGKDPYLTTRFTTGKPTPSKNFSFLHVNKDDFRQYTPSDSTYWIRPYFTQNARRPLLRPCGHSASCHQLSTTFASDTNSLSLKTVQPNNQCLSSSAYITTPVILPNGEHFHLPLPQKRAREYHSASASSASIRNRVDISAAEPCLKTPVVINETGRQSATNLNYLSSSYFY